MKNRNFFASLSCAFNGLKHLIREERNFRIDLIMAILVMVCAFIFPLLKWERCIVLALTALCLFAEAVNSALERMVDLITEDYHPLAGQAKDIASTAVLLFASVSAIIGLYIFIPYGIDFLKSVF